MKGFFFGCFLEPMLFGWASLCLGLLDNAETVVQGGEQLTNFQVSLFQNSKQ